MGSEMCIRDSISTAARRTTRRATLLLPPTGGETGRQGCCHPQQAGVVTSSRLAYRSLALASRRLWFAPFFLPLLPPLCFFAAGSSPAAPPTYVCMYVAASPIAPRAAPPPPHAAAVDRAARAVGPTPLRPSRAARRRDGCRGGNCVIVCDCVCIVWGNAGNAGDAGTRGVHLTSRVQEML